MKNNNLVPNDVIIKQNTKSMQVVCKRPITDWNDLIASIPINSSTEKAL